MTPQEEDDVRRLLADARHTAPVPDDVVARLDRVLAGLADEPTAARTATVTPLAQRRRNASRLLVAAAAVVLVGVGVGQVLDTNGGSADDSVAGEAFDSQAESGSDPGTESGTGPESGTGGDDQGAPATTSAPQELARKGIVRLRSRSFADDVTLARASAYAVQAEDTESQNVPAPEDPQAYLADGLEAAAATCEADTWGTGRFVPVRYDRLPGVLVFRKPSGDTQVADLFLCGSTAPERTVTLPAP